AALLGDDGQLAQALRVLVDSAAERVLVVDEDEVRRHETAVVEDPLLLGRLISVDQRVVDRGPATAVVVDHRVDLGDEILGDGRGQLLGDPAARVTREDTVHVVHVRVPALACSSGGGLEGDGVGDRDGNHGPGEVRVGPLEPGGDDAGAVDGVTMDVGDQTQRRARAITLDHVDVDVDGPTTDATGHGHDEMPA